MNVNSSPRRLPPRVTLIFAVSIWISLPHAGAVFAQQDSLGTLVDVGTFSVRIPEIDDWTVNVDKEKGLVEFERSKQKLLSLLVPAGGRTSMIVYRSQALGTTPGLWMKSAEEMAAYVRRSEFASVIAMAPRGAKILSAAMDSVLIEGRLYYRLMYSTSVGKAAGGRSILHLYFPPEFARTKEFFGFLISDASPYVNSMFTSEDLESIKPLMRSLHIGGSTSELPGLNGDLLREAAAGDSMNVKALVDRGAKANTLPSNGRGELALAALYGHEPVVRFLVEHGVAVNPSDAHEIHTPLTSAILGREVRIASYLVEKGASTNSLSAGDWSPLMRAISMHLDTGFVATLLAHGADPNLGEKQKPLYCAAGEGLPLVVTQLLDHGADISWRDEHGKDALWQALNYEKSDVAEILLSRGADPHAASKGGDTPLILAALNGDTALVERLIRLGANVNAVNKNGVSALCGAADNGHLECARLLLGKGAKIDQKLEDGRTPLYLSIQQKHLECIRLLLERGANVNAQASYDWTPLMAAAKRSDSSAVELLLSHGAKLDIENNEGDTALDIAKDADCDAVVALLKKAASND